jgi:hypothetical protein
LLIWVQREMHLMVRHHLLHLPEHSEPTPLSKKT